MYSLLLGNMMGGHITEGHRRAESTAGTGVGSAQYRRRGVTYGVQAIDRLTRLTQYLGMLVGQQTALGTISPAYIGIA